MSFTRIEKALPTKPEILDHKQEPYRTNTFTGEVHTLVVRTTDAQKFMNEINDFDLSNMTVIEVNAVQLNETDFEVKLWLLSSQF